MICDKHLDCFGLLLLMMESSMFSPPKSELFSKFVQDNTENMFQGTVRAEEFVEGTMINMFWTGNEWEIATRSSVGGKVAFFTNENSLKIKMRIHLDDVLGCNFSQRSTEKMLIFQEF